MKTILLALAVAAGALPTVAAAQDAPMIQPYLGLMGGRESFNSEGNKAGIPPVRIIGGLVEAVGGVNFNISDAIVLGVEGNIAKGVHGAHDWQYGAAGRLGVRAGKDSMIFGKVGRRWVSFDGANSKTYDAMSYGFGVEWSARDMGAADNSSLARVKARFQVETFGELHSIRPMAGIVIGF